MQGKKKRLRMRQAGLTSAWKKAIVTLRIGDQIKIT
jgi:ribosomal protein L23